MLIRRRIGPYVFSAILTRVAWVVGLNSTLQDGQHILMWESDHVSLARFMFQLWLTQKKYCLPAIHVIKSNNGNHYHALCFSRHSWIETVHIVTENRLVDEQWFRWATTRGYFTLRISPKKGIPIEPLCTMPSGVEPNVKIEELRNFEWYEIRA